MNIANTENWKLELYIAGDTTQSRHTIKNLDTICKKHLANNYLIKVIDIQQHPELTIENNIFGVPTLIKTHPKPKKILVGDMSKTENVLIGLQLKNKPLPAEPVYHSPITQNRS